MKCLWALFLCSEIVSVRTKAMFYLWPHENADESFVCLYFIFLQ
jgi:hypothetical protein